MLMEVDLTREINKSPINIIDEDEEVTDLDDSQSELGQMVPFYVSLNGETFSLMFYEVHYYLYIQLRLDGSSLRNSCFFCQPV